MKIKALSLLMAICMVIGMIPGISAAGIEDYPALEYNVDLTIHCEPENYTYVSFTPEDSNWYMFDSLSNGGTEAVLYNAEMSEILASDSGLRCAQSEHRHWGSTFCIVRWLEAGVTYVLGVRMRSTAAAEVVVRGDRVDPVHR